ncbi:MAG: PD-(D/E)XK nuclease family protein [Candidatus Thalassarchaeaceae archaeon]|nr:PD-(D/E)XK nuclease family protein [Candidatus Thalassarchaeaceae archaeon]
MEITLEQIPRGPFPDWILEQAIQQSIDTRPRTEGGPPRILFIHSSNLSRDRFLDTISSSTGIVDRSTHLTLNGLCTKIYADLREPRMLPDGPSLELAMHTIMEKKASELAFPLLHPIENRKWPISKTRTLLGLESTLRRNDVPMDTLVEHLQGVHSSIDEIEKTLCGAHPSRFYSRLIEGLNDQNRSIFTFDLADGIIFLNHSPSLDPIHEKILKCISSRIPIHQLCYSGSHRLGFHGMLIEDIHPVRTSNDLPEWIPPHNPVKNETQPNVHRIHIRESSSAPRVTARIIKRYLESGESDIILVHPLANNLPTEWKIELSSLGIPVSQEKSPLRTSPIVHWISSAINISHSEECFSLESLLSFAVQRTVRLFQSENIPLHPSDSRILPIPNREVLESLARDRRLIGGKGVLSDWLRAFSSDSSESRTPIAHEQTQWWFLCTLGALSPILNPKDAALLKEESYRKGCFTGSELPFEILECSPDAWLNHLISMLNIEELSKHFDGQREDGLVGLQILMDEISKLRIYEESMGLASPDNPKSWCNQIQSIIDAGLMPEISSPHSTVLVKTPDDLLGCRANRVIVVEPTAKAWDLRVTIPPLLHEEERQRLGILRPDGPIRHARHLLQSIFYSGEEVVIVDPTVLDEATPPVAPYVEHWRETSELEALPSFLTEGDFSATSGWSRVDFGNTSLVVAEDRTVMPYSDGLSTVVIENSHGVSWRSKRSSEGNLLLQRHQTTTQPLSYSSPLVTMESDLFSDRLQRQPSLITGPNAYHSDEVRDFVVSTKPLTMIPGKKHLRDIPRPVENPTWPVIGGKWNEKETMSIDPRPILPKEIDIESFDKRHGYSTGEEWKVPDVWSASRLNSWIDCGRKGWLSQALFAGADDMPDEELDSRTRGVLIHEVFEGMVENSLGMTRSVERTTFEPRSIATSGTNPKALMTKMAELLDLHAPWLSRSDVVTDERLRDLVGMDDESWRSWLAKRPEIEPSGRFAQIISAEYDIPDSVPICMEYKIGKDRGQGEGTIIGKDKSGHDVKVKGYIDRIDLVPIGEKGELIDESGSDEPAPLIPNNQWKPKRLVLIRDMKTASKDRGADKHHNGLLEDVQLAIYARAWEIEHPGDLVIGVGISDIGLETVHHIELDSEWVDCLEGLEIGERTDVLTGLFKPLSSESNLPTQPGFRGWMQHRLDAVFRAVYAARNRKVIPNPTRLCSYCPVSDICGLSEIGGEGQWG